MRWGFLRPSLSYSSPFGYKVSCSTFGITACKFLPSCAGFHLLPLCEWCPWVLCFVCVACLLPRSSWCRGGCVAFKMYHCRSFYHHILTSVYRLHVNDTGRVLHIPNQHLRSKVPLDVKIVIFDLDDDEIPFFWDISWYRAGCRFILDWDTVVVLQFGTAALVKNFDTPNKSSVFYCD